MEPDEQTYYQLAVARLQARQPAAAEAEVKAQSSRAKMGWGVFALALFLSLVADVCELSVVALPLVFVIDVILGLLLGFSAGARQQWKKWIAGFLPIPLVRIALLIWAFIASRSATLQAVSGAAKRIA